MYQKCWFCSIFHCQLFWPENSDFRAMSHPKMAIDFEHNHPQLRNFPKCGTHVYILKIKKFQLWKFFKLSISSGRQNRSQTWLFLSRSWKNYRYSLVGVFSIPKLTCKWKMAIRHVQFFLWERLKKDYSSSAWTHKSVRLREVCPS